MNCLIEQKTYRGISCIQIESYVFVLHAIRCQRKSFVYDSFLLLKRINMFSRRKKKGVGMIMFIRIFFFERKQCLLCLFNDQIEYFIK
jgi:hypothetical protein